MNERIKDLMKQAMVKTADMSRPGRKELDPEKFAKSIVFDILGELTNDDTLGPARIETIRRLAERFGVSK